jgi:hypothetical protein
MFVLFESGMHDLNSCATPVVPEFGGKGSEKILAHVVDGPDSIHAHHFRPI